MKKVFIILVLLLTTGISALAEGIYPKLFVFRLHRCMPYVGSTSENNVTTSRKIAGWNNHTCRYSETVTVGETSQTVNCNFSREQLTELVNTMRADEPNIKVKPNGFSYKSKASDELWSKYKSNISVCKPELQNAE